MISNLLSLKLKKIKILIMDVDGTLTDGRVYYSASGEAMKRFSIRDGMGVELLRRAGIDVGIITSETSQIVVKRAEKLKIIHLIMGSRNKKKDLENIAKKLNLALEEIAYIGDDVNDFQPLQIAGVSACPVDSAESVINIVDYRCNARGGDGAVREFIELILKTQEKQIVLPEEW